MLWAARLLKVLAQVRWLWLSCEETTVIVMHFTITTTSHYKHAAGDAAVCMLRRSLQRCKKWLRYLASYRCCHSTVLHAQYWNLITILLLLLSDMQEPAALREMAEVPGLIPLLPEVLSRRTQQQQQQQQQQRHRRQTWQQQQQQHDEDDDTAAAAAAALPTGQRDTASPQVVPGVTSSMSSSSVNGGVNLASMDVEVQREAAAPGGELSSEDEELEKAQAQLAWLVAALASSRMTR
jgi:hypothetical protein